MLWARLTKRQKEVVTLIDGGFKVPEIAKILKVSQSAVKHQINRAALRAGIDVEKYNVSVRLIYLLWREGVL